MLGEAGPGRREIAAIPSSKLVLSARLPLISAPFLRGEIVSVSSGISSYSARVITQKKGAPPRRAQNLSV